MHLWGNFYLSQPTFGEAQLDSLQRTISRILPDWSAKLQVAKNEDSKVRVEVGPNDRLYDCLHRATPPKRGLGSAMLFGAYSDLSIYLDHNDRTLPPELNYLTIEIFQRASLEGQTAVKSLRDAFEALCTQLKVWYANAHVNEEYRSKNIVDDETGVSAIGANITDAIPGLYWLNFFGRPYLDLIGRERLLSAPAHEVKQVDDGVLIALDESADNWNTQAYQQREQEVTEHLGRQYFFSRNEPTRQTVAPDFRAYARRATDA